MVATHQAVAAMAGGLNSEHRAAASEITTRIENVLTVASVPKARKVLAKFCGENYERASTARLAMASNKGKSSSASLANAQARFDTSYGFANWSAFKEASEISAINGLSWIASVANDQATFAKCRDSNFPSASKSRDVRAENDLLKSGLSVVLLLS
eukprot:TRINITY_DN8667_c0_g1_i6.p1 TRINITY_DN8667_c0_g1~~TRINITY_DN8667_c0_g1_i6.p1  ORF type:complete len:156 (-),score=20.24 TRINITY_DN8667_c0_g1_i6:267-734(-)